MVVILDFIISDAHYPYQDEASMNIVMKMIKKFKPDNIIMNGDMLDCSSLSRFNKVPPEPAAFKNEVEELCGVISDMQAYSTLYYIEGNHESRLAKMINDKMPEMYGMLDMQSIINDNLDTDIEYIHCVPSESMMNWGDDLVIGHFNKVSKHCGYTIKLLIDRLQINCVQGHTHRLAEFRVRTYDRTIRGWEGGCLCSLDPDYVAKPNWQAGFLVYTRHADGWNIETVEILDGKAFFRGDIFKG